MSDDPRVMAVMQAIQTDTRLWGYPEPDEEPYGLAQIAVRTLDAYDAEHRRIPDWMEALPGPDWCIASCPPGVHTHARPGLYRVRPEATE